MRGGRWTSKEKYYLMTHYAHTSVRECAKALRRSEGSVREKARRLGFSRLRNIIRPKRQPTCTCGACEICRARVRRAEWRARARGEAPPLERLREWTAKEIAILRKFHGKLTSLELAVRLGRGESSIRQKAQRLGLPHKPGGRRIKCRCGECVTCVRRAYMAMLAARKK